MPTRFPLPSGAPTSIIVWTFDGKGNAGSPDTARIPGAVVITIRRGPAIVVVVVLTVVVVVVVVVVVGGTFNSVTKSSTKASTLFSIVVESPVVVQPPFPSSFEKAAPTLESHFATAAGSGVPVPAVASFAWSPVRHAAFFPASLIFEPWHLPPPPAFSSVFRSSTNASTLFSFVV